MLRPHAATALALLALAALLAACNSDSQPLPPLTPFDPALTERLHDIRDRAVDLRGLDAYDEIEEGWFNQETLQAFTEEAAGSLREEMGTRLEAWNIAWRLLHLIGPDDDILDAFTTFDSSVVGLYFPRSDQLALIYGGDEITPASELTLVHEYVHSFQDSRWDIEEMGKLAEKDDDENSNSEFATTIGCLIEGDATLAMLRYAEEVYGPDWYNQIYGEEGVGPEPEPEEEFPPALVRYFSFNYNECAAFVAAIYAEGGWEAVDEIYDSPPRSTEAILHPDRYLADMDIGSIVPLPELQQQLDGWQRLSLLPFGELDILVYLATILEDEPVALAAATGWDGGRSAVYTKEDGGEQEVLVHIGLAFDTEADLTEFVRAFQDVLAKIAATTQDLGEDRIGWTEESAVGEAWWDTRISRFDLLVGTDQEALAAAAAAARPAR